MNVDLELQYSCKQIKETLVNNIEEIDRDGGILNMEPFPNPHTLALLARAVYSDGDLVLPKGWKLLTTASNKSGGNGYVGAAYLNPSLQQIVVSHRGTIPTNVGALWTNIKGVVDSGYTSQMNSAVTFAHKIMSVLCEVNEETEAGLQLSITGHSLGGWLGQVTAFTLQNARRDGEGFTKIHDRPPVRHVHTATFDTPGCRDMLGKIIDEHYHRYKKTVSPDELDITNYLAPPNRINTTGSHVGTIHLVDFDVSKFNKLSRDTPWYNVAIHGIDNFVKAFGSDSATDGAEATREVLDWPVSSGAWGGLEYEAFHNRAIPVEEEPQQKTWMKELRYKTDKVENSCNMRFFSERESYLLELWHALKTENVKMTEISDFVTEHNLGTFDDLFAEFDIKNRTVTCRNKKSLRMVVKHTKQLMRWFPEFLNLVSEVILEVPRAGALMYRLEARNYLASLPDCRMCFEDNIGLEVFLESGETHILQITTEDSQFQVSVVCKLLSQMREMSELGRMNTYLQRDHQTFIDWKKMQHLEKIVIFTNLYKSGYSYDDLLVIDLPDASQDTRIFKRFLDNVNKKLIIISSQRTGDFVRSLDVPFSTVHCEQIRFDDLTEESKKEFFSRKMLISGGKRLALEDYTEIQHVGELLSHITNYTDRHELKKILTEHNYTIQMEDVFLSRDDLKVHSAVNKEVSVEGIARALEDSPDALLVISGIAREDLWTDPWKQLVRDLGEGSEDKIVIAVGDGERTFKEKCREEPHMTIYWFSVLAGTVHCKTIYKNEFYIKREFANSKYSFNFVKFEPDTSENSDQDALFVMQNVNSEPFPTESNNIKTAASDEEADDIIRNNPQRPVHVLKQGADGGPILWQRSRGSLEGLRPYVTVDIGEPIHERNLCETSEKMIIIADEPGMGKSSTLTSVSRLLRPAWVIRVDLKDISFENLPQIPSLNSICEFILKDGRLRGMLHFFLNKEYKHLRKIYLFFDGFDEIKRDKFPSAENTVLRLLEYLNKETTARVIVTTRLDRREILEDYLSTFAMRFEKISESSQQEFLTKFWRPHMLLETDSHGDANLDKYAKYVYDNAKEVLGVDVQNFMGIPLQMRMLAEVCLPWVKNNIEWKTDENMFDGMSVLDLYQQFGRLKYHIYFSDKTGMEDCAGGIIKKTIYDKITEKHRMLGLRTIFPNFAETYFDDSEDEWGAELCRVGLVQDNGGGRGSLEFTHRTLAEFYCAELVVEWLRKAGRYLGHAPMVELLLTEIFLHKSNRVIRIFIENLILSESLSEDANKSNALKMSEIWREKQHLLFNQEGGTALHVALEEGSAGIMELLLGGFRCTPERLIGFLAAGDGGRHTVLARAARADRRDMMLQLVGSIERCSYEVILELLLASYIMYASVSEDAVKLLSNYLKGTADCPEIKKAFTRTEVIVRLYVPSFRAAIEAGRAAWVGDVCGKVANGTDMLYLLLQAGGGMGYTALHRLAAAARSEEAAILAHISTALRNQNISALGRAYDVRGRTPLHLAATAGRLGLVEWLINHGVWVDSPGRDSVDTALCWAAGAGGLPVARYLIERGADINIVDGNGKNLLFAAASSGSLPLLQYLIDKGLNVNSVDDAGENILHGIRTPEVRDFLVKQMARQGRRPVNMRGVSATRWSLRKWLHKK